MSPTYSCHLPSFRPFYSVIKDWENWSQSFHSTVSENFLSASVTYQTEKLYHFWAPQFLLPSSLQHCSHIFTHGLFPHRSPSPASSFDHNSQFPPSVSSPASDYTCTDWPLVLLFSPPLPHPSEIPRLIIAIIFSKASSVSLPFQLSSISALTLDFLHILVHLLHLYSWVMWEKKQITISFGTLQIHDLNLTFGWFHLASSLKVSQSSSLHKTPSQPLPVPAPSPLSTNAIFLDFIRIHHMLGVWTWVSCQSSQGDSVVQPLLRTTDL